MWLFWCLSIWLTCLVGCSEDKPNIILLITDDQDVALGSLNFMPKLWKYVGHQGVDFSNAFVTTPMCCPSRSSILTGQYVHNHHVRTNKENCTSYFWRQMYEPHTFATYLQKAGYRTGYFGKYLNKYNADYIPPGWDEWVALKRNSRYYNYTLNVNGKNYFQGANYSRDYLTDLITKYALSFLHNLKRKHKNIPFLMVLSFPAPHGTEDAAPQYQEKFNNPQFMTHRTPSWNMAPNPDKEWILRVTGPLLPTYQALTDLIQRKRLQTLLSVDDAVEKLVKHLSYLKFLDSSFMFYTSDHGYHLGQFGMVKGKSMPYEFDIRVPFLVRGPGIRRNSIISQIALNIDLAPTFLDLAGVPIPDQMDGKSLKPLLKSTMNVDKPEMAWRDTFLVERGKMTEKRVRQLRKRTSRRFKRNHLFDDNDPEDDISSSQSCFNEDGQLGETCTTLYQQWYCKYGVRMPCPEASSYRGLFYQPTSPNSKSHFKNPDQNVFCKKRRMNCFVHDRDHWVTPPLWDGPPVCFCGNSNNNTYWCLRTINSKDDFLYCLYVTGFETFYDHRTDPHQLVNKVSQLSISTLKRLRHLLVALKECQGSHSCSQPYSTNTRYPWYSYSI